MRYWNYYCALESDLKKISRYIEFTEDNKLTHSIELTRLFLASCSEIEVLLKEICYLLDKKSNPEKINKYQEIIINELPDLINETVNIGFTFSNLQPWKSWNENLTPDWWKKHNKVKHERNIHFRKANLENSLNSMSALFICVNYYYKIVFSEKLGPSLKRELRFQDVTRVLKSDSGQIRFEAPYYDQHLLIN
jgi:hypothetical protein